MKSYNQTLRLVSFLLIALGLRESEQTSCEVNPDPLFIANESIHSQVKSLDASIYPNPANDTIHIALPIEHHLTGNITILSIEGKEVFTKTFNAEDTNSLAVSTASIPAGICIVDVRSNTGRFVGKIIVQK